MGLKKEIEKSLVRGNNDVDAVEDNLMQDSVLAIASADFKEDNVLELPLSAKKRSHVEIHSGYPGKPVSRKKYSEDFTADGDEIEDPEDDENESDVGDPDSEDIDDGLIGLESEDDEGESSEEEDDGSDEASNSDGDDLELDESKDGDDEEATTSSVQMFAAAPAGTDEIKRGLAVREQLRLWESLLECRIKLEPGLVAANQLFQKDLMQKFSTEEKSLGSSEVDAALQALQELSSSLRKLQDLLEGSDSVEPKSKSNGLAGKSDDADDDEESIRSSQVSGGETSDEEKEENGSEEGDDAPPVKKKKFDSVPWSLNESFEHFSRFRDVEIDKWNEKAKISSGRAAQKDFSAFDQSILKLIESILFDKYRLVKKTQLKRADYVVCGKSIRKDNDEANDEPKDDISLNNKNQSKKEQVYDPEIFDDGDFYQKLLRDFIEAKSSDGGISKHERKLMELHRLRIKMKRKIDTKATKGRKLRYVVHQKLVNFMAPVPSNTFSSEAESQLLKSLFGQAATGS